MPQTKGAPARALKPRTAVALPHLGGPLAWRLGDAEEYAAVTVEGVARDEHDRGFKVEITQHEFWPDRLDVAITYDDESPEIASIDSLTPGQLCAMYRALTAAVTIAQKEGWLATAEVKHGRYPATSWPSRPALG